MSDLSPRQIKAIAYQLADEIETRAQPLIEQGVSRVTAIATVLQQMAKQPK